MPNIYTITNAHHFAKHVVEGLYTRYGDSPNTIANTTLLLPNKRSCNYMYDACIAYHKNQSCIVPRIIPLSELDTHMLTPNTLPPAIPKTKQHMLLTELVYRYYQQHHPISMAQSAKLASHLATLVGECHEHQIPSDTLHTLVPEHFAKHWQLTLEFLHIIIDAWPAICQEQSVMDPAEYQHKMLMHFAKYWQETPPEYPIIAAGSTGSLPATRSLLKTLSACEHGHVILPGLDTSLDENDTMTPSHPQYMLSVLLDTMSIKAKDVALWHKNITNTSSSSPSKPPIYIECDSIQEEAKTIALLLREALTISPDYTAALITSDRLLARHCASQLKRWNITIDDSAGSPLTHSAPAIFMKLLADCAMPNVSAVCLLAWLKHPFTVGDAPIKPFKQHIYQLEKRYLRGVQTIDSLQDLYQRITDDELQQWFGKILEHISPLYEILTQKNASFQQRLKTHMEVASNIASTEKLWDHDAGRQVKEALEELMAHSHDVTLSSTSDYPSLWQSLLQPFVFRPSYGAQTRLHILSPIEARMLSCNRTIIGGMNEGSWPSKPAHDPWINRPMRQTLGLHTHEHRIGQAAHDFYQLLNANDVIITRSTKIDGTQTIPSRWLAKLNLNTTSTPWQHWAKQLDKHLPHAPIAPPKPCPPRNHRPTTLSVTAIEKLRRDPYSIFASKILGLSPLDPIDQDPGAAEFGQYVHQIMDAFNTQYPNQLDEHAKDTLYQLAKDILDQYPISVHSFWEPRLQRVLPWLYHQEYIQRQNTEIIHSEIKGELSLPIHNRHYVIHARADRIEQTTNHTLRIIDYKTGSLPSKQHISLGLSPQLLLEALIAQDGGFALPHHQVASIHYWKLSSSEQQSSIKTYQGDELQSWLDDARMGINKLLTHYDDEHIPYLYCPLPHIAPRYNDYNHLARYQEWVFHLQS